MLSLLSSPTPGRGAGTGLSAVLHVAMVAIVVFGLPDLERPAQGETAIPVEFVPPPKPEPEPAEPEPAAPDPTLKPEVAEAPPEPPAQPRPVLEDIRPETPEETPAPPQQEAARPAEPADGAKPSDDKAAVIGRWILDPLTLKQTGHPCGDASETGTLELVGERGPGQYHGTLKTHVRWTRCPAQVASYHVELRIKGDTVLMVGSGFADRGTVAGDVMSLKDAYGVSVWRRQKVAAPAKGGARGQTR